LSDLQNWKEGGLEFIVQRMAFDGGGFDVLELCVLLLLSFIEKMVDRV
jgi:hypothetical protein